MPRFPGLSLMAVGAGLVLALGAMVFSDGREDHFDDRAVARLDGLNVAVERRSVHWFLAEYDRRLVIEQDGAAAATLDLDMDTGGYSWVRVCRSSTGSILLHDFLATYEVERGAAHPKLAPRPALKGVCPTFLGSFDVDARRVFRFIPH